MTRRVRSEAYRQRHNAHRAARRRELAEQAERAPAIPAPAPVEPVEPVKPVGYVRTLHCRSCYAELADGRGSRSSGLCWACRPPEHRGKRRRGHLPRPGEQATLDDSGWPV